MGSGSPHGCAIERLPQRGRLLAFNLDRNYGLTAFNPDQNYGLIAFNLDQKLWAQGRPTDVRLNAFRNVGRLLAFNLDQNYGLIAFNLDQNYGLRVAPRMCD